MTPLEGTPPNPRPFLERRLPWDDSRLGEFDAILLLDTQPTFAYSPLPPGVVPTAVIDHHRSDRGRRPKCAFCRSMR